MASLWIPDCAYLLQYGQRADTGEGSSLPYSSSLLEREENDSRLYSGQAIFCADSADRSPSTNMTTTFEGVIEGTRTTSNLSESVQ